MKNCKNCYYQQLTFMGRICQHKRSMEGTEVVAEYDFCNEVNLCKYYASYKEMENTYRIVRITDREGNDRVDGRYPLRIGRLCKKPVMDIYGRMFIYYLENSDGSDYSGKVFTSSPLQKWEEISDKIIATTRNSIYYFKKETNVPK